MYLTIHPLDRVLTQKPEPDDWADEVLTLVTGPLDQQPLDRQPPDRQPLASWIGRQIGGSAGSVLSLWDGEESAASVAGLEASTSTRVAVHPTTALRVLDVDLGPAAEQIPTVLRMAHFDGPRGATQQAADRTADRRIAAAVGTVPGYCGAVIAMAADGGYSVVVLAASTEALAEGQRRLMGTELLPGEDPALLAGPDRMELQDVVLVTVPLAILVTGGGRCSTAPATSTSTAPLT